MSGDRLRLIERYEGRQAGYHDKFRAADLRGEAFGFGQWQVATAERPDEEQGEAGGAQGAATASVKRCREARGGRVT